jgi:glycosyltransferase involved in cell wall biosynthesis
MKIWIDAKNAASQNAGIAKWSEYQLSLNDLDFNSKLSLIYPANSKFEPYTNLNIERKKLFAFNRFPSMISTLLYDLFTFRFFAKLDKPDLIFSPYYDVLMPRDIRSIISIHDLCYVEQPALYSKIRRIYFLWIMKKNAKRAKLILTVSQTSKDQITKYLNIPESKIKILPNHIDDEFSSYSPNMIEIEKFRSKYADYENTILYTGGFENRKNIPMLLSAMNTLNATSSRKCLLVTGIETDKWLEAIKDADLDRNCVSFLGSLTNPELKVAYKSVDAVVYPSLSEGFGRSCIEAMACQTPLICSDIPVFREVAGDYPHYFDPINLQSLISVLRHVLTNIEPPKIQSTPQKHINIKLQDEMEGMIDGI